LVAEFADVVGDAEDFLHEDEAAFGRTIGPSVISAEGEAFVL